MVTFSLQLQRLEMGYLVVRPIEIFTAMQLFFKEQDTARALMGDFELAAELLYRMQVYHNNFKAGKNDVPSTKVFIISPIACTGYVTNVT